MLVRVTGFREVAGHTNYEIETRQGDGEPTTVLLRNSDIRKYHTASGAVQAFPVPKRLVHTRRVKEERCGALERYLNQAISRCHGDLAAGDPALSVLLHGSQVVSTPSAVPVAASASPPSAAVGSAVASAGPTPASAACRRGSSTSGLTSARSVRRRTLACRPSSTRTGWSRWARARASR